MLPFPAATLHVNQRCRVEEGAAEATRQHGVAGSQGVGLQWRYEIPTEQSSLEKQTVALGTYCRGGAPGHGLTVTV